MPDIHIAFKDEGTGLSPDAYIRPFSPRNRKIPGSSREKPTTARMRFGTPDRAKG